MFCERWRVEWNFFWKKIIVALRKHDRAFYISAYLIAPSISPRIDSKSESENLMQVMRMDVLVSASFL